LGQKDGMRSFFPEAALDPARLVVLAGKYVNNPPLYSKLMKLGFEAASLPDFAHMAAITFADTVVSHQPFTDRLLFHELVHVVQYQKLCLSQFSAQYVKGFLNGGSYEASPLEMNAYELEARYAAEPAKLFSVADQVQRWIAENRL